MDQVIRQEDIIFRDLEKLCSSPGYVHAIAYFCFRDNTIAVGDKLSVEDLLPQFSTKRLIRTEFSTLIGLLTKKTIDAVIPPSNELQRYIEETEALLGELHQSMIHQNLRSFDFPMIIEERKNPFESGAVLREAIFYGGDSAYHFQYRDFSLKRYQKDNDWFVSKKGYSVQQAATIISAISKIQNNKITSRLLELPNIEPQEWTLLPAFIFTMDEISKEAQIAPEITQNVLESFVTPFESGQDSFSALDDFNPTNAYPILKLKGDEYLLLQGYSLTEAFYETPFFWFNDDPKYRSLAMKNRGDFTEEFSAERLRRVFGKKRVFTNIEIVDSKNKTVGEIDILVVFANRAIILQAKSKKLTIAARKGNDSSLQDDFKKAIQDAYEQGYSCANLLEDQKYKLLDANHNELHILRDFKEIYIFCVVSDHYPALSFQARQFLKYNTTDKIMAPFVMDVFLLDVMTEMLSSPLYFLSYVNRRTQYAEKILTTHEITILSYHLKQNLWLDEEYSLMQLSEDISVDIDLAMQTRRDGMRGTKTPNGILTKFRHTPFGQLIRDIEKLEDTGAIDLGFVLLSLSSETIEEINQGIEYVVNLCQKDGSHHNFTICFSTGDSGLTIHCNRDQLFIARPRLQQYCRLRKYAQKAKTWFGICIEPKDSRFKFGVSSDYPWEQSDEMDLLVQGLQKPQFSKSKELLKFFAKSKKKKKLGRNDLCLCGSGKKYKKCCFQFNLRKT